VQEHQVDVVEPALLERVVDLGGDVLVADVGRLGGEEDVLALDLALLDCLEQARARAGFIAIGCRIVQLVASAESSNVRLMDLTWVYPSFRASVTTSSAW
jgi:hypothetical protein